MEYIDLETGEVTDASNPGLAGSARIVWQSEGRTLRIETSQRVEADYDEHPRPMTTSEIHDEEYVTEQKHAKRQEISGFSAASRRRLRRLLYGLRRDVKLLFVTLTYHETWPTPAEAKQHIDAFAKRIRRRRPDSSVIWRMEPHQSGRPHFHLFITRCGFWHVKDASRAWHEVTGETSADHLATSVEIIRIGVEDGEKLAAYVAKYISKADDVEHWPVEKMPSEDRAAWEWPGRMWGITNRDALPLASFDEWTYIDDHAAKALIRHFLDEWEVDIPEGVIPPSLTICIDEPYAHSRLLLRHAQWLTANEVDPGVEVYDPACDLPF